MTSLKACVLLAILMVASACGTTESSTPSALGEPDVAEIYADVAVRVCAEARCGPGHAPFVVFPAQARWAGEAVLAALPEAQILSSAEGLVGPDGRVIDGGRIIRLESPQIVQPGVATIGTFWLSSSSEGKGETYVYEWNGTAWANVEPSTVGITVTTAVP